ncbi:hypothetical protein MUP01_06630 [Candidatus Bathyarchaeota archaeon]|nr:hypothetical protein [Candidatus Bathyarchaeota archaeon]
MRFRNSFSYHLPFRTKDAYVKEIAADLDKLANLIRICEFLTRTKVYLFWGGNAKLISLFSAAPVTIRVKPGFIEADNSAFRLV